MKLLDRWIIPGFLAFVFLYFGAHVAISASDAFLAVVIALVSCAAALAAFVLVRGS
jgi:hypothetical protein